MLSSTGKVEFAVKNKRICFYKKKYEIFKIKIHKVPQVRESKRYDFLKAFQPIYLNYLVKIAVQPRTSTKMIQYVIFAYSTLLMSKVDAFKTF